MKKRKWRLEGVDTSKDIHLGVVVDIRTSYTAVDRVQRKVFKMSTTV